MKTKNVLLALAVTISLGACSAPREEYYTTTTQTDYTRDSRDSYVFRGTELNREEVRKVQRSLAREGFYHGQIDGVWGARTSQAILDYQTARSPGNTDVTVDTLQEFGVQIDRDRYYGRSYNPLCKEVVYHNKKSSSY